MLRLSKRVKEQKINETSVNDTTNIHSGYEDEYEFEDPDLPDQIDVFEQLQTIRGICDQVAWNTLNNNATVYILTKYILGNKVVCSLTDIEPDTKYHYVCEYGLLFKFNKKNTIDKVFSSILVTDFCFANILCGKHGQCENILTGFKCSCSFLYGGTFCDKSM